LDVALRIGAHVLLHHLDVLHQQLAFGGEDAQHAAEFFIVFAAPGDHLHHVVFANVNSCMHVYKSQLTRSLRRYRTSGARETIFKNFFSRSSRATGPKTRVPTGSPVSLISTAAFWSKRIYVPSRRRCSLRVRSIMALTTVPLLVLL